MKRILSLFLALCMVVTIIPVSALANEAYTTIDEGAEIVNFKPLADTEKTVSAGTPIENLDLPQTITVTL